MSDDIIYSGVKNFFSAAGRLLWQGIPRESYIRKTVGIQALFDLAQSVMGSSVGKKDFSQTEFERKLDPARGLDFADTFFQTSGTGRQRIRNCLELALGIKTLADLGPDREVYRRLLQRSLHLLPTPCS